MFKFTGTIKVVNDTMQVTEKFSKREFVVTDTSSMYPQDIMFQSVQDKCSMLDGIQVGDQVEVSFNLRGREWTSPQGEVRYFNTLDAWRIEKVGQGMPQDGPSPMEFNIGTEVSETSSDFGGGDDGDDLPF